MLQKITVTFILLLFLQACSHLDQEIIDLPIRSSKAKILKTLGQPYKINRKLGKDYWSYRVIIEGRHYTRVLIIKDGILYRKTKLKPFSLKNF